MKLSDVKDKIDRYFDTVSANELINRFRDLGYEFEFMSDVYETKINLISYSSYELTYAESEFSVLGNEVSFVPVNEIQDLSNYNSSYLQNDLTNIKQAA